MNYEEYGGGNSAELSLGVMWSDKLHEFIEFNVLTSFDSLNTYIDF